jgi:phosphatidylcholine synthase
VLHPVRTTRLRKLNLALIGLWAILAIVTVAANFVVPWWLTTALCAIGVYILFVDTVIRMTGWNRA